MRKIFSILRILVSLPLAVNAWAPPEPESPCYTECITLQTPSVPATLPMTLSIVNRLQTR
jgi:hypothetical protein